MKKEKPRRKSKSSFKFLVVILSFSILLFNLMPVFADEVRQDNFVYLFHLYYDNDQLFADRDFEFKYDIIPEEFTPEALTTQFPYKGEIISVSGQVVSTFLFDPRRGNPNFLKGKISIKASYAPNGQKAVFYDSQNRSLVTIFVSESSFCNEDGICNSDRGEDDKTCSNDCKVLSTTNNQQPMTNDDRQGDILKTAIYVLIIAGAALGGWFGWRWWQKRKELSMPQFPTDLPPQPPQSPDVQ